jgi:hypothetical protein
MPHHLTRRGSLVHIYFFFYNDQQASDLSDFEIFRDSKTKEIRDNKEQQKKGFLDEYNCY